MGCHFLSDVLGNRSQLVSVECRALGPSISAVTHSLLSILGGHVEQ